MSAFVCILDRSGADLDPREVRRLAEPLESYGDALSSLCRGPVAVAVRHAVDPSPRERHGPLADPDGSLLAAVAGGFVPLGEDRPPCAADGRPEAPPCAAIALDALRRRETGFPAGVTGSFVVITADPVRGWLSLARDHLGDLKVYYHLGPRWFLAASEPAAILRHPAVGDDLDEHSAARFLGFRFYHSERSFFEHVKELPPAHRLRVSATDSGVHRYWRFRLHPADPRRPREAILTSFRDHLERSMASQTAGLEPARVALSLSGGLDSTALAALAPPDVKSFSWSLGASQSDERRNIEAVAAHLKTRIHWVDGAGLHPLGEDYVDRFVHPNSPHLNAFAALKHRLYRAARAQGCRRVMVGDAGDALYAAAEYWLRDALTAGRPGALEDLARTVREAYGGGRSARRTLRRLLPLPAVRRTSPRRRMPWLTDLAVSLLPSEALSPILPAARWKRRYDLMVGAKHSQLESEERRLFAQCGIGRSSPFWYWPLLEMVINLPAWWYEDGSGAKVLTRVAMRGLLPTSVLDSRTVGHVGSFYLRGIEARRRDLRETVFRHPRSDWQRYVRRSWLEPYLEDTDCVRFGHTILWWVISYELWQRELMGS